MGMYQVLLTFRSALSLTLFLTVMDLLLKRLRGGGCGVMSDVHKRIVSTIFTLLLPGSLSGQDEMI